MERTYAISTRLEMTADLRSYLVDYIKFYNSIQRRVLYDLLYKIPDQMGMSKYITHICNKYGILKRSANSVRYDMQGRIKAYNELKKTELVQIKLKIRSVRTKVGKLESVVSKMKPKAAGNKLSESELDVYRNKKASLYYQKNRLNRLCQRRDALEKQIKDGKVSICFGSKKLFDAQHRLLENGFQSHGKWRRAFREKRDSGIFFLGSGDERCGNQLLQLTPDGYGFQMQLRKDKPYEDGNKKHNYIRIPVKFRYMAKELAAAINEGRPITYRIARKGRKWYLTAIFSMDTPILTDSLSGVVGIDYNDGFIEYVATDRSGNMVGGWHVDLEYHGCGARAEDEIKEELCKIVRYACAMRKDVVIEDLDFKRKKAGLSKGRNVGYNRMLHLFDYHRYTFWLENLCLKYGVNLVKVNPAYTSVIGRQKYSFDRKLTVHRAAALVIARRGQGFVDQLVA